MRYVIAITISAFLILSGNWAHAYSAGDPCGSSFPNGSLHGINNSGDYNFLICRSRIWRKWMNYNTTSGQMNILNLLTGDAGDIASDTDGTASISLDGDFRILGDGYVDGVTLIVSDRRMKTNITSISDSLEKIRQLNGVNYHKLVKGDIVRETGVIAQDLRNVFPDLVNKAGDNGLLLVNYNGLIAPLIEAVKQLSAQNERLEQRIMNLESSN